MNFKDTFRIVSKNCNFSFKIVAENSLNNFVAVLLVFEWQLFITKSENCGNILTTVIEMWNVKCEMTIVLQWIVKLIVHSYITDEMNYGMKQ